MQCASSTATSGGSSSRARAAKLPDSKRSGATYSSLYSPRAALSRTRRSCAAVSELFMKAAGMPAALSAATWSFMREIRGETTSVTPGSSSAGI